MSCPPWCRGFAVGGAEDALAYSLGRSTSGGRPVLTGPPPACPFCMSDSRSCPHTRSGRMCAQVPGPPRPSARACRRSWRTIPQRPAQPAAEEICHGLDALRNPHQRRSRPSLAEGSAGRKMAVGHCEDFLMGSEELPPSASPMSTRRCDETLSGQGVGKAD
jgi:hypothetical protein